jgi:hypothetical protein
MDKLISLKLLGLDFKSVSEMTEQEMEEAYAIAKAAYKVIEDSNSPDEPAAWKELCFLSGEMMDEGLRRAAACETRILSRAQKLADYAMYGNDPWHPE